MKIKLKIGKKTSKSLKFVFKRKPMKMNSGSFYIPKRNKSKPLGEDAHFVSGIKETFGVADGVGGWAKKGIDSGIYARSLMRNSLTAVNKLSEANSQIDPKNIIKEACKNNKFEGSSTACVVTHNNGVLRGASVGDSGFLVFREGKVLYKSPTQQKRFNCPFQLGNYPESDDPECAVEMKLDVKKGDFVVMGSDGLLDNLFDWEIEEIIKKEYPKLLNLEDLAFKIAEAAYYRSLDKYAVCPYTITSKKVGKNHKGGKQDDISVVIGHIVENWEMSTS